LTRDNALQQRNLDQLAAQVKARCRQLEHGMHLRALDGGRPIGLDTDSGAGQATMAAVRDDIARMQNEELRLLKIRDTERQDSVGATLFVAAVGSLFSIGLVGLIFFELTREVGVRKRAEEAVRASEERLQSMLDNTTALVFLKDTSGRMIFVNRRFEEVFGKTRDQILGRKDCDVFAGEVAAMIRANDRTAMETGQPVQIEEQVAQNDGLYTYLSSKFALRDASGAVAALCGFAIDITARKSLEEQVTRLNDELTVRAAELEVTNKELEAFSYSVSHDLRAPLRSIDGFSQALLEDYSGIIDSTGQDYLGRVRAATQRMGQLIDDMLTLSRITRADIAIGPVDLSSIARDVAAELEQGDPERKVEFVIQDGVAARGDARLLKVALENLLGNAWKFTSKHPRARIEFGVEQQSGERVYFVRDDGAGFDAKYAAKLFGAFQRLHAMNEFSGTGIGLATVARVVHRHKGRVWAEGAVEQGAAFYFTL
jgi:PAS domain S-box-containing protein